ncbi:hypothetical protein MRB53_010383 [Persea americana]|uniref:Uncharacterized protein n=1 Tax=Persea americana TaxID=3435 RepID=A0ACC2LRJ9_PERAE|nr:hypothetical protein MRB53_010383 [Persea americana]
MGRENTSTRRICAEEVSSSSSSVIDPLSEISCDVVEEENVPAAEIRHRIICAEELWVPLLAEVVESESELVAQLECLRSHLVTLEKETADLDVLVKDRQCSLELDSSKIKGLEQSLSLVDGDLRKLSFNPAFLNEVRTNYTSSVEFEARSCIEDVLFSLQQFKVRRVAPTSARFYVGVILQALFPPDQARGPCLRARFSQDPGRDPCLQSKLQQGQARGSCLREGPQRDKHVGHISTGSSGRDPCLQARVGCVAPASARFRVEVVLRALFPPGQALPLPL